MFNARQRINANQQVLTAAQYTKLVANHKAAREGNEAKGPIVKFFDPMGAGAWLISDLDPETGIAFGLCDLGQGFPELGYVSLDELCSIQRSRFIGIERDTHFKGGKNWDYYLELANSDRGQDRAT